MQLNNILRFITLTICFGIFGFSSPLSAQWEKQLQIPKIKKKDQVVRHTAYTLSYCEAHEQAYWVAYCLTKEQVISKNSERGNNFRPDPDVSTGSATAADYQKSGYDRGHLAPAADMAWSDTAMSESFYFSNMSPQLPGFNRGVWKRLEDQVRQWAIAYDTLYIATGPILTDSLPTIGPNEVSVPKFYYKALLRTSHNDTTAIAFVLPNESSSADLMSFAITVDELEKMTGIDFFRSLNNKTEKRVEATICLECWK